MNLGYVPDFWIAMVHKMSSYVGIYLSLLGPESRGLSALDNKELELLLSFNVTLVIYIHLRQKGKSPE